MAVAGPDVAKLDDEEEIIKNDLCSALTFATCPKGRLSPKPARHKVGL